MSPAVKKMRAELQKRITHHRHAAKISPPTVAAKHAACVIELKQLRAWVGLWGDAG